MPRRAALAVLLGLLCAPARAFRTERLSATGFGQAAAGVPSGGLEVAAEQVLVRFSTTATSAQKDAAVAAAGGVSMEALRIPGWSLITLSSGASVVPALNALPNLSGVLQVAPNRTYSSNAYPSDPLVSSQYNLSNTGAFAAWDYGTASTGKTTIAIIDTGIDGTHPDLAAKLVNASAAIRSQNITSGGVVTSVHPPTDACGHGTQTASVAAAITNNGVGVAGVAWGAQLISLNVFASGCGTTTDAALAAAIDYAANTLQNDAAIGKLIVNMSVGGPGACTTGPLTQAALSNLVTTKGVPAAISSGNNGSQQCTNGGNDGVDSPANCAGVSAAAGIVPVGATDLTSNVASFSCRGTELNTHGVSAPGVDIPVDAVGGGTSANSGTSFSSPLVAGLMAMILSARQTLTPAQLESYIRGGAYSIGGQSLAPQGNASGAGQVNLFNTMRLVINGTLADFDGQAKPIAFPNPFKPSQSGTVSFAIPPSLQGASLTIKIYTLDGTFVRSVNGLSWDGKNTEGTRVASGTYVFVVTTSAGSGRGRFSVLR